MGGHALCDAARLSRGSASLSYVVLVGRSNPAAELAAAGERYLGSRSLTADNSSPPRMHCNLSEVSGSPSLALVHNGAQKEDDTWIPQRAVCCWAMRAKP